MFREDVGEDLVLGVLELVVGLIFIWVGLHKFIIRGLDGFYLIRWGQKGKIGNFDNEPSVFGWGVGSWGFFLAYVFLFVLLWLFIFLLLVILWFLVLLLLCGDGILLSDIFRFFLVLLIFFFWLLRFLGWLFWFFRGLLRLIRLPSVAIGGLFEFLFLGLCLKPLPLLIFDSLSFFSFLNLLFLKFLGLFFILGFSILNNLLLFVKANSFSLLLGTSLNLPGSFGGQSPLGCEGFLFLVDFVGLD